MSQGIRLKVQPEELLIAPGRVAEALVVLENRGDALDQFDLSLSGLQPGWFTLSLRGIALFPGDSGEIELAVHPPRDAPTGSYKVELAASSRTDLSNRAALSWYVRVGEEVQAAKEQPPGPLPAEEKAEEAEPPPEPVPEPPPEPEERRRAGVAVTLEPASLALAAGEEGRVVARVRNTGEIVDQVDVSVEGLDPSAVRAEPSGLALFPGDSGEVVLTLQAPPEAESQAGDFPFRLTASSRADPAAVAQAQGILRVRPAYGFEADLRPLRQVARTGRFHLQLSNPGNAPLTILTEGRDAEDHCLFSLEPPEPQLPPHGTVSVPLTVKVRRSPLVGSPKPYAFTLELTPREWPRGRRTLNGELVHRPYLGSWRPLLALGALLAVLVVLFRPHAVGALGCRLAEATALQPRLAAAGLCLPSLPPGVAEATPTAGPVVVVGPTETPTQTPTSPATLQPVDTPTAAPHTPTSPPPTATATATATPSPLEALRGRILFASDRRGDFDIYLLELPSLEVHPVVTEPARDWSPSWWPDGRGLVYSSNRIDGGTQFDIFSQPLGGRAVTLIRTPSWDEYPAFSPDFLWLTYASTADGAAEIFLSTRDGAESLRLTHNRVEEASPTWAPDSRRLAYASLLPGSWSLFLIGREGGQPKQLSDHPGEDRQPAWSPREEVIAFARDGDIYLLSLEHGREIRLTERPKSLAKPSWSPDGRWLVFECRGRGQDMDLCVMPAAGGEILKLVESPANEIMPAWGP